MNDWAREYSKAYLNNYDRPWEDIPWDFIRAAEASVADLAVIPMWDLLCCGSEGRMNHPSTLGETGNGGCFRASSVRISSDDCAG